MRFKEADGYRAHTAIKQNEQVRFFDTQTNTYIWLVAKSGKLSLNCEWKPGKINCGETTVIAESDGEEFEFVD